MPRQLFENKPENFANVGFSVDLVRVVAIVLVIFVHTTAYPYCL